MLAKQLLTILSGIFFIIIPSNTLSQDNPNNNLAYQDYSADSSFFIGGVSLSLLRKGQAEVNTNVIFDSFQFKETLNFEGFSGENRFRITTLISRVNSYLGMSEKAHFDIGFRVEYSRKRIDDNARSSPLDVFLNYDNNDSIKSEFGRTYGGLTRVGLRFRLKPLANDPRFTILGGYSVGAIKSEEFQQSLSSQSDQADLNLVYSHSISPRVYYYFALGGLFSPPNRVVQVAKYSSFFSFYLVNMSLNNRLILFPGLAFAISGEPILTATGRKSLAWTNQDFLGFVGLQVQINRKLVLSGSYNLPITRKLSNPDLEIIPNSQTLGSLSARVLF